jgi:hypothetical protein
MEPYSFKMGVDLRFSTNRTLPVELSGVSAS